MEKYKRENHKHDVVEALTEAQKLAFAPLTFQAISVMLELGILAEIDKNPIEIVEIQKKLNLSEYAIITLLEIAQVVKLVEMKNEKYFITQLGKTFLYDEMTRVNFNFVKDVCYLGANELKNSFLNAKPEGLKKMFEDGTTIYPYISKLPDKMRKSWYEFDHYYSNNCFDIIYKILKDSPKIFDIGGNTGIFEKVCLKNNPKFDITMLDLPENIEFIKKDKELKNCKFYKTDILDENSKLPSMSDSIIMSQFLDCFSKKQIIFILKRIKKVCEKDTKIYILEPFIDEQKYAGAKYSLIHTSLYFTCMANGCSKMYSKTEMEDCVNQSGLKVNKVYDAVGIHDYTLLECVINA